MSLYAHGARVWIKSLDHLGKIAEANYVRGMGGRRKAHYIVDLADDDVVVTPPLAYLTGSDDLRAADWCCDGCGRWLSGQPHKTTDDGEYADGLGFCFLCVHNK